VQSALRALRRQSAQARDHWDRPGDEGYEEALRYHDEAAPADPDRDRMIAALAVEPRFDTLRADPHLREVAGADEPGVIVNRE
jgi:hypothetical protein